MKEILEGNPENKKLAKRVYRKIGSSQRKKGDNIRSITSAGRKLFSILPKEHLRSILANEDTNSKSQQDSIESFIVRRKQHNRSMHPHLAREKNISTREKLEKTLDRISKNTIGKRR